MGLSGKWVGRGRQEVGSNGEVGRCSVGGIEGGSPGDTVYEDNYLRKDNTDNDGIPCFMTVMGKL